jgi:hypothetical protein
MRAMVKRWYFWLTVLVMLPALCIAIGLIYSSQSPINQANYDRIRTGMTEEQVAAILRGPGIKLYFIGPVADGPADAPTPTVWANGLDVIIVTFHSGKVTHKGYTPPTAWKRLRWHVNEWLVRLGLAKE